MVFVRKVTLHNVDYFYLFHTETSQGVFHKHNRYIGTNEPTSLRLKDLEKQFLKDIRDGKLSHEEEKKHDVIKILQDMQQREGYIGDASLVELAKELHIPLADLVGVATFYSQFKLTKPGKYTISICNGTACHIKHSPEITRFVSDYLKIHPGQVTSDGKFGLESVNCIGACARAPAMMINGMVYGELDREKIKKILGTLN
ncbi:NAD(P)H-dependent oxidoreductase subunit E [Candidatus Woesearchaeota archaeon]|nr:NAD(P)H-dependent oxidoreductase subunit E [Candidatus Woesearchaeota archaeon]